MIKVKPGFEVQEVCDQYVLMAMGEQNIDFTKIISLNETSLFIWNELSKGVNTIEGLANAITTEYDIDLETAKHDIEIVIDKLRELGVVE